VSLRAAIVLLVILAAAFVLRIQSVSQSVVVDPIRSDARDYMLYAHNLERFGVYSRADTWAPGAPTPPEPDAVRPPGYPLFLLPFLSSPPRLEDVPAILRMQAILSTLTVLVVFVIGRLLLPTGFALAAAALSAASPHLVTMNIYVLSETLFGLLLALALYLVCRLAQHATALRAALAGLALAAAALTHPLLVYFVVPLSIFLLLHWSGPHGARRAAALALAFGALHGAWTLRNALTPGVRGDDTLMLKTLRIGAYRDFMYQDRPETYGYPYRFDPRFEETSASFASVIREIADQIAEAPAAELGWYARKPLLAWTWDPVQGQGDVFIYPVARTPYADLPHFRATHFTMQTLHDALVALMWIGVALAWLPPGRSPLEDSARFCARVLSLLVLYHAALMAVGFPLPRYSVPLRPCQYILAMLPLATGLRWHDSRRRMRDDPRKGDRRGIARQTSRSCLGRAAAGHIRRRGSRAGRQCGVRGSLPRQQSPAPVRR
jgi:antibiotic biosynthesis monooxygenase (ABM) superfamily enzyme